MKRAQRRLYFLRKLKQASLPTSILWTFYNGVVESVLTYCISTWYSSCSISNKEDLQRIVRGVSLPSVHELFQSCCRSRALNIVRDTFHPLHTFFELLPSGKWFRSHKGWNNRHFNSFLQQAGDGWTVDLEHVHWCTSRALSHNFSFKWLYLYSVCYLLSSVIDSGETLSHFFWAALLVQQNDNKALIDRLIDWFVVMEWAIVDITVFNSI